MLIYSEVKGLFWRSSLLKRGFNLNYFVLEIEVIIYFPSSGTRNSQL